MDNEQKTTGTVPVTLRSKFCDGNERTLESPAQQAVDTEIKHPRQSPVQKHEPFEPFGLN